ncbi:MAG: hypothetical protein WCK54_15905 [Desulfuromonadales bacterium]
MFNLAPKSLRVSLKLCVIAALLIACSGCMPIANALVVLGERDGLNRMTPNQNSGEIIYTQAPYIEPEAVPANPDAVKVSFSNLSSAKQP